jgi:alkanesulfonate monooxygenase
VRIGIIARETEDDAWRIAHARFPEDRSGQIAHAVAMKVSDSRWHQQLSVDPSSDGCSPYWLVPFQNYKCPYLVGDHSTVAQLVVEYVRLGARTFILDVPSSPDELHHSAIVFRAAVKAAA